MFHRCKILVIAEVYTGILCAFCLLFYKHKTRSKKNYVKKLCTLISLQNISLLCWEQTKGRRGSRRQEAVGVEIHGFWTYFEGTAKRMWDERSREIGDDCRILENGIGTEMRMLGTDYRQEACAVSDNPKGFNTDPGARIWPQRPRATPTKSRCEYIGAVTVELTLAFVSTSRSKQGLQDSKSQIPPWARQVRKMSEAGQGWGKRE